MRQENEEEEEEKDFTNYAWFVLFLLMSARIMQGICRQAIGFIFGFKGEGIYAGDPKYEMRTAFPNMLQNYGLISGPMFALSYGTGSIFMGQFVDRYPRKVIYAIICMGFGLCQITSGLTNSFLVLCLARFMTGFFVSAVEPCGYSILGDYFPQRMRVTANSLLMTGPFIAAGASSLIVLLVSKFGWRAAYMTIGVFPIAISLLITFFLKEPERGFQLRLAKQKKMKEEPENSQLQESDDNSTDTQETPVKEGADSSSNQQKDSFISGLKQSLVDLSSEPISRWSTIGACLRMIGTFSNSYYTPLFYLTMYPQFKTQFAVLFSIFNIGLGFMSSLGVGVISDRFGQTRPMIKTWVCIVSSLGAMPFYIASMLITDNFYLSMACTAVRVFFGETYRAPNITMIQDSSRPDNFGKLMGAYQFLVQMTIFGSAFVLDGLFRYFSVQANPHRMGGILAMIGFLSYSTATLAFFIAGKHYTAFSKGLKYLSFLNLNRESRGYDKNGFKEDPNSEKLTASSTVR